LDTLMLSNGIGHFLVCFSGLDRFRHGNKYNNGESPE
jgi:hypothetical protein